MSLTTAERRSLEAEWKRLRGRPFNASNLTHRFEGWFSNVNWREMPSNQFAAADEMRAAGWQLDHSRDDDGRLAE